MIMSVRGGARSRETPARRRGLCVAVFLRPAEFVLRGCFYLLGFSLPPPSSGNFQCLHFLLVLINVAETPYPPSSIPEQYFMLLLVPDNSEELGSSSR